MIEGHKQLAAYVETKHGIARPEAFYRRAVRRQRDPLPCEPFAGRQRFRPAAVDDWVKRQLQPRKRVQSVQKLQQAH